MAVSFQNNITNLNLALSDLHSTASVGSALHVASNVLSLLGDLEVASVEEIIDSNLLKLPNSERQDPWFHSHPWMRGERAAFELLDSDVLPLQAKFYWLQKKGSAFIAGGVHFTKNWEDHDFTRTAEFKVGIDFFLTPDAQSVLVVLSNRGKLRVLELTKKLSNTQIEIFEKWFSLRSITSNENLHTGLWESFKLQSVNAQFYDGVSDAFNELLSHLKLLGRDEEDAKLFSSRLMGRLIFIWFLRRMGMISESMSYFDADAVDQGKYYRDNLERLFFCTLNLAVEERSIGTKQALDTDTPYLNGGLFSPQADDWVSDNELTFPPAFFTRLYEHFDNFNFTTDESTPEYEQVAIDPEMLGRVFESLLASQVVGTGEQARKAKGAFYTPREIVAYMCREVIRGHLEGINPDDARISPAVSKLLDTSDQEWAIAGTNSLRDIPSDLKVIFAESLTQIKTIDPACGSGAFPLGLLQLLVKLQLRLDPRLDGYKLKLSILQNNIFGVDIEPMAVEISRLRSWLSLIVEEKDKKIVEPLPNLDFNFICANSLISIREADLLTDPLLQEKLQAQRQQYFKASNAKKKSAIQAQYFKLIQENLFDAYDERSRQLKTFNPFDAHQVSAYFDAENMFGISDGFDVVVGNPPYIGLKGHVELFEPVKKSDLGKRFFSGKMDYFYFFFHLSLDLLRDGGTVALITTNYYLTATYSKKLIEDFSDRASVKSFVNFNEVKLFDSALGQHNLITVLRRGKFSDEALTSVAGGSLKGRINDEDLTLFLNRSHPDGQYFEVAQDRLIQNNQIVLTSLEDGTIESALEKLANLKTRLSDVCKVNQGVVSGGDKVSPSHIKKFDWPEAWQGNGIFVLTREELKKLMLDKHELEIIKPFFKNSDIRKYATKKEPDLFIIYAVSKTGSLENRPKLREHIMKYYKVFESQRDCAAPYLNLPRSINFAGPKIVAPQRSKTNTFGYNSLPWYSSADVYYITEKGGDLDLLTVLGLLNSKLYFAWLYFRGKRKGEALELYQEPLANLPMPTKTKANSDILKKIGSIATELTSLDSLDVAKCEEIDSLVSQLFSLSEAEVSDLNTWSASFK